MEITSVQSSNPMDHARNIEALLGSLKDHCRAEIELFSNQRGKSLLDTTADVLEGLEHAFHEFVARKDVNLDEFSSKSDEPWD